MHQCCYLSVAEITIHLEADCEIILNEEFHPFICDEVTPDIRVHLRKAENMPAVPERLLYSDMFCAVTKNEVGHLQKFFFGDASTPDNYVVTNYNPDNNHILIEYPNTDTYKQLTLTSCFYWLGFEAILLQRNQLCIHASCIETPFGGILFSGISGIGKSTQADLWCRYRNAQLINGDRPILAKGCDRWMAWGSPYAGSSKVHVNNCCPVKAIVLLKQAPVCSIRKLTPGDAFRGVWAGLTVHTWEENFVEKASALAIDLISAVPVFEFSCTPDQQAVAYLEQALKKELCL